MKSLLRTAVLINVFSSFLAAQEMAVGLRLHPGDPVRIAVSFKSPIMPSSAMARFELIGPIQKDQAGFNTLFDLSDIQKISDKEYELATKIPNKIATGQFRLTFIIVTIDGVSKRYNPGADFHDVTLEVTDNERSSFPDIENVKILSH